jgi:hypothetical protein
VLLALAAATVASFASAQDDKVNTGSMIWKTSGCAECHGPFANGEKQDEDAPTGANLRTSRLDAAALKETISCGRAGAGMPAFDEGAYTVRACSGQRGARPDDLYPAPRILTPDEIDSIVAYLQARIIGRGRITLEECLAYYDNQPDSCEDYR